MSRFKAMTAALRLGKGPPAYITPGLDVDEVPLDGGFETLRSELERLYWQGIKAELENIIHTLQAWQEPEFADSPTSGEDDFVHGYDAFLDHVSQGAREFAIRHDRKKQESFRYEPALCRVAMDRRAEYVSTKLKSSVRRGIEGFLDIDKLIEHRPPLNKSQRPAIPQLTLAQDDSLQTPKLQALRCARPDCNKSISGSMFVSDDPKDPGTICEDCYWQHHYGDDSYSKAYKHCVLQGSITPEKSRQLCSCRAVPHHDGSGIPLTLFPVNKEAKHNVGIGQGDVKCSLLELDELVGRAKYDGLLESVGMKESKLSNILAKISAAEAAANTGNSGSFSEGRLTKMKTAIRLSSDDMPSAAETTKSGALIALREVPVFHERFALATKRDTALVVSGSSQRTLWKQTRKPNVPKRYKAVMKQVIGAPFTGIFPLDDELEIGRDLLAASKQLDDLSFKDQAVLDSVLESSMHKLKNLLQIHVRLYLNSLASRLFDPNTTLAWSADNNCQTFCNSLIDASIFEPLVSKPLPGDASPGPLYLFSFVTRSPPESGYVRHKVNSKYDVPLGYVEEYLLRFHFGHNSSDLIDTCHEYWTDWAAFDGPIHPDPYHSPFPWDCTEAYGRYPTVCGGHQLEGKKDTACNLSKHIWAFPFDAWSFIAQHLTRDKYLYPTITMITDTATANKQQQQSWTTNRLTLLRANTLLSRAAVAMAGTPLFHAATAWLHSDSPTSLLAHHTNLARVRLGGIHRAQPFSHYFDTGRGGLLSCRVGAVVSGGEDQGV
ncbi:hypothetical protein N657DRAFT_635497 [Parathielavia appendiculata]|uniref:Uncharacterized protein n=1 Tax=Parathielavia appendiculata TaxID=2587402 RepID=A0AAN6Z2X0_9PEZI|nr:hypothetical protein N657DRAFT_635497 [Parathielavia appendiculata]